MEHRAVLWLIVFVDPRGNFLAIGSEDKDELVVAEMDST